MDRNKAKQVAGTALAAAALAGCGTSVTGPEGEPTAAAVQPSFAVASALDTLDRAAVEEPVVGEAVVIPRERWGSFYHS